MIEIPAMVIVVKAMFDENKKYYQQVLSTKNVCI